MQEWELVSTSLTEPTTQVTSNGSEGPSGASPNGARPEPAPAALACAKCGSPMQPGQDWCLQCGTVVPGGLGGGPGWRTGVAILATAAALVIGASVAAYAALNKTKPKRAVAALVVRAPGASTAPTTTPVPAAPGTATTTPGTPSTLKTTPPLPTQTPTPTPSTGGANAEANNALFPPETKTTKASKTTTTTKTSGESTGAETSPEGSETKTGSGAAAPSPILLDTNAAGVYNPYGYPATLFGDPSLAIDGEAKTGWTAQVQAEKAPAMAEGLVLDLHSPQKLGSATVKAATVGITVEVYGANGHSLPASISASEWKRLVGLKVLKKKSTTMPLKTGGKSYRYIVLWLAKAPSSSTAATPGSVSIDEFELFPPK
jgi:hypothetical protein